MDHAGHDHRTGNDHQSGYDHRAIEAQARALWERHEIYRYHPNRAGPVFSVDTPPPYVSAGHLHVGHAMSYTQPDVVVRYRRMRGERIFYPMGFDDNGLPTERYVEQTHQIRAADLPRDEFVARCLAETRRVAAGYEELWRRLGLSVDWRLRYSTIAPPAQRTAQARFLLLYEQGYLARAEDPVLWCPECRTALAQADIEDLTRTGTLHRIAFTGPDGARLPVATTRPELLPACVALYHHPDDDRYRWLAGGGAQVPLCGHGVPIRADRDVDPGFGTGLMMVCTFGDTDDITRWRRDELPLRDVVTEEGCLNRQAGVLAGLPLASARTEAVARLAESGALLGQTPTKQAIGVHERCGTPVEFQLRPQWFLRVRVLAGALRQRATELTWVPEHMRQRLLDWIDGLRWDWNLSRQRHYGVPFPVWYCRDCATPMLASQESLPVDPLAGPPPATACLACGGTDFDPDPDVLDTWWTSSLSPQLNAGWADGRAGSGPDSALAPMSLRVQAHEIIRSWLFYSLVQSHLHTGQVPWHTVMISGHGLNEQGRKISKRELAAATDGTGYNRYVPEQVIDRYGADALRMWATKARVGADLRYREPDVRAGRKLAVKLWNVGRFLDLHRAGGNLPTSELTMVDRWLLSHLADTIDQVTTHLDGYDVKAAQQAGTRFFRSVYCDHYLEMVKGRFDDQTRAEDTAGDPAGGIRAGTERASARTTLHLSYRALLGLLAPFVPFVTEHLYQHHYQPHEGTPSLHVTPWPVVDPQWRDEQGHCDRRTGDRLVTVLNHLRARRSALRLGNTTRVSTVVLHATTAEGAALAREIGEPLRVAARAGRVTYHLAGSGNGVHDGEAHGSEAHDSGVPGLALDVLP